MKKVSQCAGVFDDDRAGRRDVSRRDEKRVDLGDGGSCGQSPNDAELRAAAAADLYNPAAGSDF